MISFLPEIESTYQALSTDQEAARITRHIKASSRNTPGSLDASSNLVSIMFLSLICFCISFPKTAILESKTAVDLRQTSTKSFFTFNSLSFQTRLSFSTCNFQVRKYCQHQQLIHARNIADSGINETTNQLQPEVSQLRPDIGELLILISLVDLSPRGRLVMKIYSSHSSTSSVDQNIPIPLLLLLINKAAFHSIYVTEEVNLQLRHSHLEGELGLH
jgi:hypothetical protein